MSELKTPLNIYVIWHPNFECGYDYAKELYANFTRDVNDPLSRGIGIPIFFKSREIRENCNIDYTSSNYTLIIILVDSNMVADENWHKYVDVISEQCGLSQNCILLPIAIDKSAFNISDKIKKINFVPLYELCNYEQKKLRLIFITAHELCRLLYGLERTSEVTDVSISPAPVTLFISHAKEDGVETAKLLNDYIQGDTPLKSFFDANDISFGYDFTTEIEANIQNCVLLVIHSDKYSSREWCRKEIILAKKYNRPIIVVNVLNNGEDRSFPYMANVKTIRAYNPINKEKIIAETLKETLRFKYQELFINYLVQKFDLDVKRECILSYPPELFSLLFLNDIDNKIIVYPEPPLSDEEIEILQMLKEKAIFATPSIIPCLSRIREFGENEKFLSDYKVGISISENADITKYGFEYIHLQDYMVEIARYLLVCGVTLAYGGDIHYNHKFNFVKILVDLVRTHNKEHKDIPQRIYNFIPYPYYKNIDVNEKAELINIATFVEIPPIDEKAIGEDPLSERYNIARNLSKMREIMDNEINARIIIGGKIEGYKGKYPGVLEETYIALKNNKPVFLLGAFGGVAKSIIHCLKGETPDELTEEYQLSNLEYKEFYHYYNDQAKKEGFETIDYSKIVKFLKSIGISGLNNGLSNEENEVLFKTSNVIEAVTLVSKGLANIKS